MLHQRNVEGLRENAQKKRQEAIERTEQGIRQLLKEGRSINFKTVAEVSNVSTAWLYKEPEIKARIEHLREQGTRNSSVPPQQKATDASKDAKYQALKKRLQEVEAENRGLRDHLEAIHGRQRVLADENDTQRREIERLTKLLNEAKNETKVEIGAFNQTNGIRTLSSVKPNNRILPLTNWSSARRGISDKIQAELDELGIQLNTTLEKKIKSAPVDVVSKAIDALKQRQAKEEVGNPSGFLVRAIEGQWTPNQPSNAKSKFPSGFLEAYQRLCDAGVVDGGESSDLPVWNNEIYVRVLNPNPKPWEAPYIQMHWKEALEECGLT